LAVNPAGTRIATGGSNGTINIISRDGKPIRTLVLGTLRIVSVAWGRGDRLLAAGAGGEARVWEAAGGGPQLAVFKHRPGIRAASLSADGTLAATGGRDGVVRIWRVADSMLLRSTPKQPDSIAAVAFDPAHRLLASASGPDAYLWRVDTGEMVEKPLLGHTAEVKAVAFDPRGRLLATSGEDREARIWDVKTRRSTQLIGHGTTVVGVAFSRDSRWLATVAARKAAIWQVRKSHLPRHFLFFLAGHTGPLTGVAFTRGRRVVTSGDDGTIRTYACDFCGRTPVLKALAQSRLHRLTAERKR
jgi:WD40 repeat protein